ncbi:short-chain dehydrogenase [Chromobacterium sphagni]|uniref:Short-chain dehydrogenase n=1 Tax=Chromobacterium sphagni TaxID=1903179 RepID=A0A1S1WWG3_9NEIS|nr:SDR family oxidoreductase [Chromobacterium sphagni]OHX11253.1 short-chain dehydrogenase [Chromobacterium sphagni]
MTQENAKHDKLAGKTMIVAGGARGIGAAIAEALARQQVKVCIFDTDRAPTATNHYQSRDISGYQAACELAETLTAQGLSVKAMAVDATAEAQVVEAVGNVAHAAEDFYGLVNAIGSSHVANAVDSSLSEFEAILQTNLTAPYLTSREAGRALIRQGKGGAILNISSIAAKAAFPGISAYCAAKAGLQGFSGSLALELAPHNIRVNCVCPGIVKTNMWKYLENQLMTPEENLAQLWARMEGLIPLGRTQTAENIARFCVAILENEDITAQSLSVDGGMNLHG